MLVNLAQLFIYSFFLNLLWELSHSLLYTTCLRMRHKNFVPLILKMTLKDAVWILAFYLISTIVFMNTNIFQIKIQVVFFLLLALLFSFVDEKVSLKMKRWEYSRKMPTFLGVGITSLFELAVTGFIALLLVF